MSYGIRTQENENVIPFQTDTNVITTTLMFLSETNPQINVKFPLTTGVKDEINP